eukprot:gb/GEZN01011680.1/.p1 GENE.gb/GEZN01011680.1/~~gb/GEZN01011680.1/.p1  ORF type:complete len:339 (+),score=24.97 gb/GEZN01011680.1/:22-1038(+)
MGGASSSAKSDSGGDATGVPVVVHVYDPTEGGGVSVPGMGVYHSGVEVYGTEYSFAGGQTQSSGVYTQRPKYIPSGSPWKYRESIEVGRISLTKQEVKELYGQIRGEWPGNSYDLTQRNCNHFGEAFCTALGVPFPGWVNRAARIGSSIRGITGASLPAQQDPNLERAAKALELRSPEIGDLLDVIDTTMVGCSNASAEHDIGALFDPKQRTAKRTYLQSNSDAQLLIHIPFRAPVKLHELVIDIDHSVPEAVPRVLHLFKDKRNLDFEDAESFKPTQSITIEAKGKETSISCPLKLVHFQQVSHLTIFVESNAGDSPFTRIKGITLIGRNIVAENRV